MLAVENEYGQNNEDDNEKPSPDVDDDNPKEGDYGDANNSQYVLDGDHDADTAAVDTYGFSFRYGRNRHSQASGGGGAEKKVSSAANIPDATGSIKRTTNSVVTP